MKSDNICSGFCCGCGVCQEVCPKKAITIQYDERGFLKPVVDLDKCINCKLCIKFCNLQIERNQIKESYALKIKDLDKYQRSQSGGAFTLISDYVLSQGGVIYGACVNKEKELTHVRVTTEHDRNKMHGSLYIQSKAYEVYESVWQDLLDNKQLVLFIGTPCQVAGIYKFLIAKKADTHNLIMIDLLCHGVPSIYIWRDIIKFHEEKNCTKYTSVELRGIDVDSRPYMALLSDEMVCPDTQFKKLYHSNLALRESCYHCEYSSINRVGDISIGDATKAKQNYPDFFDPKGVSLVFLNTSKGKMLFENVRDKAEYIPAPIEDNMQQCLFEPAKANRDPREFWNDYDNKPFKYIVEKYADHRILLNLGYIINRGIKLLRRKR